LTTFSAQSHTHSPSPQLNGGGGVGARRGSLDLLEEHVGGSGSRVDTTSNVRVSAMLGNLNSRADSWDAIAKTRNLLSYGSLESLANLAARPEDSAGASQTASRGSPLGIVNAVVTGDALKLVPVNRQASFDIELPDGSTDPLDVTVSITAPSRRPVAAHVFARGARLVAQFTASEVGEHAVDVRVRDARVAGAPFRTHAYDARAIAVGRIPDGVVGRPVEFESE
ncbi:Uncharacterized protein GBIM_10160, partial [Gryllus bimaculatus]